MECTASLCDICQIKWICFTGGIIDYDYSLDEQGVNNYYTFLAFKAFGGVAFHDSFKYSTNIRRMGSL
jgi:hypothetical protein